MRGQKLAYYKKCGRNFPDRRVTRQKSGEYEGRLEHIKKCYNIYADGTREQLLRIYANFFQRDRVTDGETEETEAKRTAKANNQSLAKHVSCSINLRKAP